MAGGLPSTRSHFAQHVHPTEARETYKVCAQAGISLEQWIINACHGDCSSADSAIYRNLDPRRAVQTHFCGS